MPETAKHHKPSSPDLRNKKETEQTYVVRQHESMSSVVRKFYGDLKYTKALYKLNEQTIGSDPDNIKSGMVLTIPSKSALDSWMLNHPNLPSPPKVDQPKKAAPPKSNTVKTTPNLANKVALSFDDGPSIATTHDILKILKDNKVHATFFVTGDQIKGREGLIAEIIEGGHQIGNHSYHHKHLTKMTPKELEENLRKTEEEVARALNSSGKFEGKQLPEITLVRPPGGRHNPSVDAAVNNRGDRLINWNVNSLDWDLEKNPQKIISNVLAEAQTISTKGGNILLHDRPQTKEVLDKLIKDLKARGYSFISTEEFAK